MEITTENTAVDQLLRRADVAMVCQVSLGLVDKWRREGTLECVRLGNTSPRFRESAVRAFIESKVINVGNLK